MNQVIPKEFITASIAAAFSSVEYPGDWCLTSRYEGHEPVLVEQEFTGKTDWRTVDPEFLDQAPSGFGSALSFFSDEAFRFYLPAYMIADTRGQLNQADPSFHLTRGLDNSSRATRINPQRYGERTWFEHARHKFSMFNRVEAAAIVTYLTFKRDNHAVRCRIIDEALQNYWRARAVWGHPSLHRTAFHP